jgi:ribosomal protein L5
MIELQESYLKNSRRDLVSKLNHYQNVHEISYIKNLTLSFLKLGSYVKAIMGIGLLFLVTSRKGRVIARSRSSFSKFRSCDVKLKKKTALSFLESFLFFNLNNILDLEDGFNKKNFSSKGTFAFNIRDIFSFVQLDEDLFKFRELKNLTVSLAFSKPSAKENTVLLRTFGIIFK